MFWKIIFTLHVLTSLACFLTAELIQYGLMSRLKSIPMTKRIIKLSDDNGYVKDNIFKRVFLAILGFVLTVLFSTIPVFRFFNIYSWTMIATDENKYDDYCTGALQRRTDFLDEKKIEWR